jgi:A/G-specific adenine glycosylase
MASTRVTQVSSAPPLSPDQATTAWVGRQARRYYRAHGRSFPWRDQRDPFLTLVTELLLQKTRAEDVAANWEGISQHLATPSDAACASDYLEQLLARLGLARRGAWVVEIAARVRSGRVRLDSLEDLQLLPGVASYTASAVMVFAHGRRVGLVDANILRICERLWPDPPEGEVRSRIRSWYPVTKRIGGRSPRDAFWGLLDVGASCCTARSPDCGACPFVARCNYAKGAGRG